jgi:hypothetical protein
VENFPGFPEGILGVELTGRMREQSERCGTRIFTETVEKVDLSHRPFKVGRGAGAEGGGRQRGRNAPQRAVGWATSRKARASRG